MSVSDKIKNRGAHGDSSFMLGGVPSSSENPSDIFKMESQKFCWRLAEAWKKVPDWRFGQLMVNCLGSMETDPFFPEDDEMIQYIEKWCGANNPYGNRKEET